MPPTRKHAAPTCCEAADRPKTAASQLHAAELQGHTVSKVAVSEQTENTQRGIPPPDLPHPTLAPPRLNSREIGIESLLRRGVCHVPGAIANFKKSCSCARARHKRDGTAHCGHNLVEIAWPSSI